MPRYDIYQKFNDERYYESGFYYHIWRGLLFQNDVNLKKNHIRLKLIAKSKSMEKEIANIQLILKSDLSNVPLPETFYSIFREEGDEFFNHTKDLGKVGPNSVVLDIGCGIGKMAMPFTKFLSTEGKYYGFDIVKFAIDRCKEHIEVKYPNFHFDWFDIQSGFYNKEGQKTSSNFAFPYENSFFDLIFLNSVFTHMFPKDIENYLSEIFRVLKPGGRCVGTFLLVNKESVKLMQQTPDLPPDFKLKKITEEYYTPFENNPEKVIGHDENFVLKLLIKHGFKIEEPIRYGYWCGRNKGEYRQDIVVGTKPL